MRLFTDADGWSSDELVYLMNAVASCEISLSSQMSKYMNYFEHLHAWNLWFPIFSPRFVQIINILCYPPFSPLVALNFSLCILWAEGNIRCAIMYHIISFHACFSLGPLYFCVHFKRFRKQYYTTPNNMCMHITKIEIVKRKSTPMNYGDA